MDDGLLIGDRVVDELVLEIGRYLALVTMLRQDGLEPSWQPERVSSPRETSRKTSDRPA